MKKILLISSCMGLYASTYSQAVKLLYKSDTGWDNPLSWIQTNAPVGQPPIQRVPTELDDVVISKSMSGISTVYFFTDNTNPDFNIGGSNLNGTIRCRSMHISNTTISFSNPNFIDYAPIVNIYTQNGGFVMIDSGSNMLHGRFQLHGGNPAVTDLQVLNSLFGTLFSHANWSGIKWETGGRGRFIKSHLAGFDIGGNSAVDIYADSCVFETVHFFLGDNSVATILNSKITNNINNTSLRFSIGHNTNFISAKDTIDYFSTLEFTSSGSAFNGDVNSKIPGAANFLQKYPTNPQPNIINGNCNVGEVGSLGISGDLKISGNFSGFADVNMDQPPPVMVNNVFAFHAGGITNYANTLSINNCVNNFCHFKLEFYGNTNSNIIWNGGLPVDTLIINKSNCAKVSFDSSLYVSGATRILSGQLTLNPNANHPYKFVCAGNVDIAVGGGLFLRRDGNGILANMAVGGTLMDHNLSADSTCAGFSNPYGGIVTLYPGTLPLTLVDLYGRYRNFAVTINWKTENEINTKHFIVEKSKDLVSFIPLSTIASAGSSQGQKKYVYTDNSSLQATNYYRLKMVDKDEKFTYSKTIAMVTPPDNAITIFPNPVKDHLSIRVPYSAAPSQIVVTNANGKVIKKWELKPGLTHTSVNTVGLMAGVYTISFQPGKVKYTQQFLKQ